MSQQHPYDPPNNPHGPEAQQPSPSAWPQQQPGQPGPYQGQPGPYPGQPGPYQGHPTPADTSFVPPPSQPAPAKKPRGLTVTLVILGLVVALGALGTGVFFAYRSFAGGSVEATANLADIAERPSPSWTLDYSDVSGDITDFSLWTAGPGLALAVIAHDFRGTGYTDTLDLAMIDVAKGTQLWRESDIEFSDGDYGGDWRVLTSDASDVVGIMLHDSTDRGDTSDLILFSKTDGTRVASHSRDGYVRATLAGQHVFLVTQDDYSEPATLQKFPVVDPGGEVLWEQTMRGGQTEVCVTGDAVVVGRTAYSLWDGCIISEEGYAFDVGSGDPAPWARATREDTTFHVSPAGLLQVETDYERGRGELILLDSTGADKWERSFTFRTPQDSFRGLERVTTSDILVSTSAGLEALDIRTGKERWDSAASDVHRVLGVLGDEVIGLTEDRVVWIDMRTGETNHTLRAVHDSYSVWSPGNSQQHLYLISDDELIALDRDGAEAWSYLPKAGEAVRSAGGHLLLADPERATVSGIS